MYRCSITHEAGKLTLYYAWDNGKVVEVTEKEFNALEEMPAQTGTSVAEKPAEAKVDYSKMKNQELIDECNERGLDISAAKVKADYVALLEADDKSEE